MSVETPFRINDTSENYLSVHTAAIAAFTASNGSSFHASAGAFQSKSLHSPENKVRELDTHSEPRTPPPSEYRRSESKDCSPETPSGGERGKYPPSSVNSDCYTSDSSCATTPMKWEPSSPPGGSHPYAGLVPFNFPSHDEHKEPVYSQKKDQNGLDLYFCHLCSYTGTARELFSAHMNTHFEHRCPHCDYTSRTEGRLKRHIKDFHSSTPPDNYSGNKTARVMPGRPKVYRCKQCEFVATEKLDFWSHARSHIKEDKLLQCPKCPFVTEYKHHLEYHLRNHFGSKPFKCNKCNYACVNKSMLNSHMKSHTNVYQYRCADCTYATKYCHSLKLHLRKYNHKPATVLNADGSLPQGLDAEAAGLSLMMKRGPPRGPRGPRKDKLEAYLGQLMSLPHLGPRPGLNGLISPYWPLMGQFPNGFHQPPPLIPVSAPPGSFLSHRLPHHHKFPSMPPSQEPLSLKCTFCPFSGENRDDLNRHMLKVHVTENQDLFSMFGITSESLLEEQSQRAAMEAEQSIGRPADFSQKPLTASRPPSHPSLSTTESLHIRTDTSEDATKSSPRSWPPSSTESPEKETMNSCKSMPELFYLNNNDRKRHESSSPKADSSDILRQMTLKFGSGPPPAKENREIPLDLTKPKMMAVAGYFCAGKRTFADMESSVPSDLAAIDSSAAVENSGQSEAPSPSPRKRSRKGKAYKLDTISWKLQGISSEAGMPRQEDVYSNNSDVDGELDETSNHSSNRDIHGHFSDLSPRNRADLNMSGHSDDKDYTQFSDFKDGPTEEHDGSYLSEKLIEDNAGKESEQNADECLDRIENSSTGGDFEQIHQNLKILNEGEIEKKDGLHSEDRCPSPVSDLRRCSQGSSVGLPSLPVIGNGSRLLPVELQSQAEKNQRASGLHSSRRPGQSSAAVRRGAEIAWRILHPDQMNLVGPYQNGYSPVRSYQGSERSPPMSGGNSHFPLAPTGIPATQKLPSKVNGMNGIISSNLANHGALGKKLSREGGEKFECSYCDIAFRDCVMYTMHMGYHDYQEPFKCNMCGNQSRDKVEFFLHIARTAHA